MSDVERLNPIHQYWAVDGCVLVHHLNLTERLSLACYSETERSD